MAIVSGRDEYGKQQVITHRHSVGARPKRSVRCNYGTLVSDELTGDTDAAGHLRIRDNPEETETAEMEIG